MHANVLIDEEEENVTGGSRIAIRVISSAITFPWSLLPPAGQKNHIPGGQPKENRGGSGTNTGRGQAQNLSLLLPFSKVGF